MRLTGCFSPTSTLIPSYALRHSRIARWDRSTGRRRYPEYSGRIPDALVVGRSEAKKVSEGKAQ